MTVQPTFPERIGFDLPEGVTLIESHLVGFVAGKDARKDAVLEACHTANSPWVLVELPYADFVTGPGIGFAQKLIDVLSSRFYHVTPVLCHFPLWGVPIDGRRLMLVAGPHKLPINAGARQLTTVQDWGEDVLYHSQVGMPLNKVKPGLFPSLKGVVESRKTAFGDTFAYLSYKPIVAVAFQGSYRVRAVTPAEWCELFGVELCTDFNVLAALTPTVCLNQFIDWVMHAKAWEELQPEAPTSE